MLLRATLDVDPIFWRNPLQPKQIGCNKLQVHALPVEQPLVGSPGKQLGSCRDAVGDRPTVLAEAGPGIPAYDQEVFGPVACITRFSTLDEAVKLATGTEYGLALGIFIADVATAHGGYWNPPG
jgi:hypothetical protein